MQANVSKFFSPVLFKRILLVLFVGLFSLLLYRMDAANLRVQGATDDYGCSLDKGEVWGGRCGYTCILGWQKPILDSWPEEKCCWACEHDLRQTPYVEGAFPGCPDCSNPPPDSNVCGDGVVAGDEVCDGNSKVCAKDEYYGKKECKKDCSGFKACVPVQSCGDGKVNGPEVCDKAQDPQVCTIGNQTGEQICKDDCTGWDECQLDVTGLVIINEVNTAPRADWNSTRTGGENFDGRSGRGKVNQADEWVELYINQDGLDLTQDDWQIETTSASIIGNLRNYDASTNPSGAFNKVRYFAKGTGTGTIGNTKVGDYVLLGNLRAGAQLSDQVEITLRFSNAVQEQVSINGANTGLLDETQSRLPNATGGFSGNHATPGRENKTRGVHVFEAEVYTRSSDIDPKSIDVYDTNASEGLAIKLVPGTDNSGEVFRIPDGAFQSDSYIQIKLRAKIKGAISAQLNSTTEVPIGSFFAKYPNAKNRVTGFWVMSANDFSANNTYREYVVQLHKPNTSGFDNEYWFEFDPGTPGNINVFVDKITVEAFTPVPERTYQAENYYTKAGSVISNEGRTVVFSDESDISLPWQSVSHYHFVADQLNGDAYRATWTLKINNVQVALDSSEVARLEIRNHFDDTVYHRKILKGEVTGSYQQFHIDFAANVVGSYQYRVITNTDNTGGKANIYVDKVTLAETILPVTRTYEAENLQSWNGGSVEIDSAASNGQILAGRVASSSPGILQTGPYSLTESDGQYYQACFYLQGPSATAVNTKVARIRVINKNGASNLLAEAIITEDMLQTTGYLPYCLTFKAMTSGVNVYQIYSYDVTDILSDKVVLTPLGANPTTKVYQAEGLYKNGGMLNYSDTSASNDKGLSVGISTVGVNGSHDGKWLSLFGPFERQEAGTYDVTFRIRKAGGIGNTSSPIAVLRVVDESGTTLDEKIVLENDLTGGFSFVTLAGISNPSEQMLHFRVFYYGGLSGITSDLSFDKVILEKK